MQRPSAKQGLLLPRRFDTQYFRLSGIPWNSSCETQSVLLPRKFDIRWCRGRSCSEGAVHWEGERPSTPTYAHEAPNRGGRRAPLPCSTLG